MKRKFIYYILFITLFIIAVNIHISSAQLILKNKYLKITMDELTGRFTIKTIEGHPYEKKDSNCDILNNTCWPPTTFASIKYNNRIYEFGCSAGDIIKSQITGNKLIYSWKIKDITVSQTISLVTVKSNPLVYLKYQINNHSNRHNNAGIRLCLDTALSKDIPNYVNSSYLPIQKEIKYSSLKKWFCIDSLKNSKIYLRCYIPKINKITPEKIIFSSWEKFDKNKWDINIDKEKSFYNSYYFSKKDDGAVGIFWAIPLEPEKKNTCSMVLSLDSTKLNSKSMQISLYSPSNIKTNSIYFKIKNQRLKNIEDISIRFETDKPQRIILRDPEIKILNLALFESDIIECPYLFNANTDEDISFKVVADYSVETSYEKKINLSSGKPKIQVSIVSNTNQNIFPMDFIVNHTNCINPKKRFITVYNCADIEIYKTEILLEQKGTNKIRFQWHGKDTNDNLITEGTYYYYSTSFSNFAGDYFESEKGIFIYPGEPIESETNITFIFPDVNFDYNRAVLKKYAFRVLHFIARIILEYPDKKYLVNGHTDNTGEEEHNLKLSEERARSVFNYLTGQFTLEKENFTITGYGSALPVTDNATESGRQKNRRVEIIIEK